MTQNISSDNLGTVRTFFSALERRDKSALGPLLAADVVETVPFSRAGSAEPESEFRGREAVLGYLDSIIDNFTQTVLADKQFYVSEDASTVFVEAKGDLVLGGTSAPYRNVYVFKFAFEDGIVVQIKEYANPVTYAKLMDLSVGRTSEVGVHRRLFHGRPLRDAAAVWFRLGVSGRVGVHPHVPARLA